MNMLIKRICFLALLLVTVSLPFPYIHINSVFIIISLFFSVLYFFVVERKKIWNNNYFLLFAALYAMHYLGFINSTDTEPAFFDIEQKLTFLVLPMIFVLGPAWDKKQSGQIILSFVATVCVVCLLTFRNGFYWGAEHDKLYDSLLVHRPYLGMYCTSCVFFCFHLIALEKKKKWQFVYLIMISFLVFFLIILIAKMALVALFVLMVIYVVSKLLSRKRYIPVTILIGSALTVLGYFTVLQYGDKLTLEKNALFNNSDFTQYGNLFRGSFDFRLIYWSCSTQILSEGHNWLIGVGTGDVQPMLDSCYLNTPSAPGIVVEQHHDPHNQYFATWLALGLLPLILFLAHLFSLLYIYVRKGNLVAFIFTVGIILFCVTESIMKNQKGIVFYTIFQSLFMFGAYKGKADHSS